MKNVFFFILMIAFIACGNEAKKTENTAAGKANEIQKTATPQPTPAKPAPQTINTTQPTEMSLGDYGPKNEGWHVKLDDAFNESKKTGKPIMANFTGSDWCGWCKRLDQSVFHQPGFADWAKKNVVLLELDFPRRFKLPNEIAAQNRSMQQSLGVRGYPTIWLFDLDKDDAGQYNINALGKTGYTKTLEEFQSTVGGFISKRG